MNDDFLRKSNNLNEQISDLFITMPRQFGRTKALQLALYYEMCYTYDKELVDRILEIEDCSIDEIENYIKSVNNVYVYYGLGSMSLKELSDKWNEMSGKPTDAQITTLKSQLKHCKNPLQKLNLEREIGRLIRERRRR
jgi:hypothetical protein